MVEPTTFRFSPRSNRAHLIRWREWGAAAFDEAARTDKLVALFITAFWCGVCQHLDETALSSDEVQLLLNAYFVPVRVEEARRPDVDLRYTQEGWPTIVFLTPGGEPILSVNGLETEALIGLLVRLVDEHPREGDVSSEPPRPRAEEASQEVSLGPESVDQVVELLIGLEDRTLDVLAERTIYDQKDGGFFRYSSTPDWNEPHRDKLLGDQANFVDDLLDGRRVVQVHGSSGRSHEAFGDGEHDVGTQAGGDVADNLAVDTVALADGDDAFVVQIQLTSP